MTGDWPADWDDPAAEEPLSEAEEAQLAEVSAFLATVSIPELPDAVADRISAAMAAEAAARAEGTAGAETAVLTSAAPATPPSSGASARPLGQPLGQPRKRFRPRRQDDASAGRRDFRVRPLTAAAVLAICLVLSGLGYGLSRTTSPASSGQTASAGITQGAASYGVGAAAASPPRAAGAASSAGSTGARAGVGNTSSAFVPQPNATATPSPTASSSPAAAPTPSSASFVVVSSGTNYLGSSFISQVEARLKHPLPGYAPTQSMVGCAQQVLGSGTPLLFDVATFQGTPVYVIAASNEAFAIKTSCSATSPAIFLDRVALSG